MSSIKIWRRQQEIRQYLGKIGHIVSYTQIHSAGQDFIGQTPYFCVLVELLDGEKLFGQLAGFYPEGIRIGQKVISILRLGKEVVHDEIVEYALKWRVVAS